MAKNEKGESSKFLAPKILVLFEKMYMQLPNVGVSIVAIPMHLLQLQLQLRMSLSINILFIHFLMEKV